MAIKVYKVVETTDIGAYIRTFNYAIPEYYNDPSFASVDNSQQADDFVGLWVQAINKGKELAFGDGCSPNLTTFIGNLGLSNWIQLSGTPCRDIENLTVGRRFYFADNTYVRISEISKYTQWGIQFIKVTWTYVKNGVTVGSISNDYLRQNIDTSYQYRMRVYAIPLIPLDAGVKQTGGGVYKQHAYYVYHAYEIQTYGQVAVRITSPGTWSDSPVWLQNFLESVSPVDTDNPYVDAGVSDEGGGDPDNQNFDDTSDDVEEDPMPTLSAVGTGMATIFKPDVTQLKYLSQIFWGASWWQALQNTVEGIDKMFVSLGIVPFSVTAGPTVEVSWLGLSITEVMLTLAGAQYYEFDMGTIDLSSDTRIWRSDSAMDYSPFSKLGIFLPFIGYQELDIDECRGATIQLIYRIDILSGACVALVKIAGNTIYQFAGNCMTQIPLTAQSFENLFTNVVNVGIAAAKLKTAGAVAGGGDTVTEEMAHRAEKPITKAMADYQHSVHSAQISNARYGLENATANAMMGLKPSYDKTGAISSSASLMCVKQPYLFLTTPRVCIPDHYQRYAGFPANITDTLGHFEGFTVVNSIRLNNLVATSPEIEEIYELLHDGVII